MELSDRDDLRSHLAYRGASYKFLPREENDESSPRQRRRRSFRLPSSRQKSRGMSMLQQTMSANPDPIQEFNAAMSVSSVDIASRKIHVLSSLWRTLERYIKHSTGGSDTPSPLGEVKHGQGASSDHEEADSPRHYPPAVDPQNGVDDVPSPRFIEDTTFSGRSRADDGRFVGTAVSPIGAASSIEDVETEDDHPRGQPLMLKRRVTDSYPSHMGERQNLPVIVEGLTGRRMFQSSDHGWSAVNLSEGLPSSAALGSMTLTALISRNNLWWAGIICSGVAALLGALGDCVLRYSFVMEREGRKATGMSRNGRGRPFHLRPLWILGMFLSAVLNPFLTLVSYRFTAVSVVALFGGLHTVGSLVFAYFLFSERLGWRDVIGGLMIVGGITIVVIFGHNADDTQQFIVNGVAFVIFSSVAGAAIAITVIVSQKLICSAKLHPAAISVCTALLPGLFGAISNICGKGAVVLWTDAFQTPELWSLPYTWIFAAFAVLAALGQAVFLSISLSTYPASFVSPVYNGVLACLNSLGGIWVFSEYTNSLVLYLLGVMSTCTGIWIASYGQETKRTTFVPLVMDHEEPSMHDDESAQLAPDEMEY